MDKVNAKWVTDFASAAEAKGIQISLIDAKRLAELVKDHRETLIREEVIDTPPSADLPKTANPLHPDEAGGKLAMSLS